MSARSRRPSEQADPSEHAPTEIFDPTLPDARLRHLPPGAPIAAPFDSVHRERVPSSVAAVGSAPRADRSEPIRVISMKEPSEPVRLPDARPRQVQIRSIAEVKGREVPEPLGRLAPPRDPDAVRVRGRQVRSHLAWAVVGVALAAAIAFAIWLIAGHVVP